VFVRQDNILLQKEAVPTVILHAKNAQDHLLVNVLLVLAGWCYGMANVYVQLDSI